MRLKQSLCILLLVAVASTAAAAASASQLVDVGVVSKSNNTTVSIKASGAFTHTEYRPTDNLLLVDLAGVSAAKLENRTRELRGTPGVESYRVVAYKGASGADITRVELTLAPGAVVNVAEAKNAVNVHVTGEAVAAKPAAAKPEVKAVSSRPATIRNVSVSRGKSGLQINIAATGSIAPTALTLKSPDRIVIDVPNSMPLKKSHEIAVNNGAVKAIRMSRYALNPPSTRIVVDLSAAQQFELAMNGTNAVVKLQNAVEAPVVASAPAAPAPVAKADPKLVAETAVLIEPKMTTRAATSEEATEQRTQTPSERAAQAISSFRPASPELPAAQSNASLRNANLNMAVQQATQQNAAQQAPTSGSTSCGSGRYNGEPISVNLKDVDLRDFFRLIHEISGLNVVLDPQVRGSLTIVLDDVPWDQALAIVLRNNGLDCQLEGNVLRIATTATMKKEAEDRRAQADAEALAVPTTTINRPLSYAVAGEAAGTIKGFLSARGNVIADNRTNALIISDIPSVIPNVDRLIKELDRKPQEVEIEARVVAANRSFGRDIGTQLGFGWANGTTFISGAGQGNSPIATTGGANFNGGAIPLFSNMAASGTNALGGIGISTQAGSYRLDFLLTMGEARGLLKILSRPRVVTQNNVRALIRQGTRIPVVTGAQLGGPPTTTYVDAFLRLTVRPQITAEGTVFLDIDVENTTPDFSRTSAINLNPVLVTQQATTQVLVTDGGTVVIGGVIQTQSNVSITQIPLLGNIPVFGNLFKRRSVSTSSNELIFFITPKIIQT